MTAKEHYDNHLAAFYSWMLGNPAPLTESFRRFCLEHRIVAHNTDVALDLGAGNGIQSHALEMLGFNVFAIDFNTLLLQELKCRCASVNTELDDIRHVAAYAHLNPTLVVCCGDTITHLDSFEEIEKLVQDIFQILTNDGKFIVSFRDYSTELTDTNRFIPVKSDSQRVFTCFLEYFADKVKVTDLLYQKDGNEWKQKASSYFKVRLTEKIMCNYLTINGFEIEFSGKEKGVITIIAKKVDCAKR